MEPTTDDDVVFARFLDSSVGRALLASLARRAFLEDVVRDEMMRRGARDITPAAIILFLQKAVRECPP